jgi:hypothetical protein
MNGRGEFDEELNPSEAGPGYVRTSAGSSYCAVGYPGWKYEKREQPTKSEDEDRWD